MSSNDTNQWEELIDLVKNAMVLTGKSTEFCQRTLPMLRNTREYYEEQADGSEWREGVRLQTALLKSASILIDQSRQAMTLAAGILAELSPPPYVHEEAVGLGQTTER